MTVDLASLAARVSHRTQRWPLGYWYWGDAIAVDALLEVDDERLAPGRDRAVGLIEGWLARVPSGPHDSLGPGAAMARMEQRGILPERALDRFLEAVDRLPLLYGTVPVLEPQLPRFRFGVCIDAAYHLPPALAWAGLVRDREELSLRAVQTSCEILDRLRCPDGWAQWYDVARDRNNGVAWSRGVGWALLGALDTLAVAEGRADCSELDRLCAEMVGRLLETQLPSGHWGPVLGRSGLPEESSVAPFFLAAVLHPRAGPWEVPAAAVQSAAAAMIASVAEDGVYLGVSSDVLPSWEPASYERFSVEPSPWGQGAALRGLVGLARSVRGSAAA